MQFNIEKSGIETTNSAELRLNKNKKILSLFFGGEIWKKACS
jgi:hypothetical protein